MYPRAGGDTWFLYILVGTKEWVLACAGWHVLSLRLCTTSVGMHICLRVSEINLILTKKVESLSIP